MAPESRGSNRSMTQRTCLRLKEIFTLQSITHLCSAPFILQSSLIPVVPVLHLMSSVFYNHKLIEWFGLEGT